MASAHNFLKWKQTRPGLIISGAVEAGLAYAFGSLAIDTGSLWYYALALVFLAGASFSFAKAVNPHGRKD